MSKGRIVRAALAFLLMVCACLVAADNLAPALENNRFLGHLSTDKPIYRIGERVYLRCVVLNAVDHAPLPEAPQQNYASSLAQVQILGPKHEILGQLRARIVDSVAAFLWEVPPTAAGGQYTARISFPGAGYPTTERQFEVRAYRAPRLKGEIIFLRDGYGAGDTVKASLHVERAEGGIPAGATVTGNAIVDSQNAFNGKTVIDASGNCTVEFKLPAQIEHGDGTLSLAVADGGVVEPIAKTIPILINNVDLSFYPEGGDLVAGLPCRVYVEARTPAQKPADLVGVVVDSQGKEVANLRTEHEGRGRFTFTPTAGQTYALKLSQPAGIARNFPLPDIKAHGAVLAADLDVAEPLDPIRLHLSANVAGKYTIALSKRETEIASTTVTIGESQAGAGQTEAVVMTPPGWADGVLVATAKGPDGTPVSERLVFRKSAHALHVKVTPDKSSYVPGDNVSLTINTTDDNGKPTSAIVGLTATDQSILRMMEQRDRAPHLSEMVLLENDVRDLADAQVYLDPSDPKSNAATDLLLGTQGWRRFATVDRTKFISAYGLLAHRVLADLQPVRVVYGFRGGAGGGGGRAGAGGGFGGGGGIEAQQFARAVDKDGIVAENAAAADAVGQPDQLFDALPVINERLKENRAAGDVVNAPAAAPAVVEQQQPIGLDARALAPHAKMGQNVLYGAMETIREYAHALSPGRNPGDRTDFTETLYWSAGIKTDEKTGSANVSFKLSDAVTSFEVSADGFDSAGNLGEAKTTISSVQPFYIEPKIPLEVSTGDLIQLPIAAVNGTSDALDSVQLSITAESGIGVPHLDSFKLASGERSRQLAEIHVGSMPGEGNFVIHAQAGSYSDQVARKLVVRPTGFPTQIAVGGLLDAGSKATHIVKIPDSLVAGSLTTNIALYPTPAGNLAEALTGLIRQPNGCFEQTTSTNYPLVMADQYFLTHSGIDPTLIARSNDMLTQGYQKLVGFECQKKGYEWFGEDPGHECLTAYGLLEFTDMAAVRPVDAQMLQDTRNWLLARRDGQGGYTHERRSLHTWITDPDCANGYCTWALLECGQTGLEKEVKWLGDHAAEDSNSYAKALAANSLFLAGDHDGAKKFMDQLAKQQAADGHVAGATTSVVGSGGESLDIETTSLAALAWLRDPAYAANVEKAIHYLADSCQNGRYGSTQSTVLALRGIVTYDKARAHPTAPGKVQLFVDDKPAGDAMAFDANTTGALKLPDVSSKLTPGKHDVELRMTDGSQLPYAIAVEFNSLTPSSSDQCKLAIATSLKDQTVAEGAATEAEVTIVNHTDATVPTPIAIIGIPGGLEVRHDQLKELVKADRIAAYEVRGRDLILYWRDMQARESVDLPISLTAAVPGQYSAPASRAYLYYTDEFKQWQPGLKVTITTTDGKH